MRGIHSVERFGASRVIAGAVAIVIFVVFALISAWAFQERAQIIADYGYRTGSNLAHNGPVVADSESDRTKSGS